MDSLQEKIDQLKVLLKEKNEPSSDQVCKRFLVAYNYDLNCCAEKIVQYNQWRRERELDKLDFTNKPLFTSVRGFNAIPDGDIDFSPLLLESESKPIEDSKNLYFHPYNIQEYLRFLQYHGGACYHKTDKQGRPVYIEKIGMHDARNLSKTFKADAAGNFHIIGNEMLERVLMKESAALMSKNLEKEVTVDKLCIIFDCKGMGFHQLYLPALQIVKFLAEMDQKFYPEMLGVLYVVNSPFVFTLIWNIIQKWLEPKVIQKVKILSSNFRQELLENIEPESLPEFLGGQCRCDHLPMGCVPNPKKQLEALKED